ncbi:lytic transglycosylase domain-containing protein [Microvirga terrae]|uniref:Lytic transglycosylase domain-containing protein n=1 Tax=Microvirga terrae TaxID=2740529 RepID=A0ABY5RP57_9HYPH|nr:MULTISPECIES: transglycosylase SLT domain-containing protein [Microvirga]MBQ0822082.1 transglycosylase SLT domain-containing protein [Microvirga sp. HBU67558]UVF19020.1 lytic transglycosylase domain-containing protein [Microvirga terrae]
MQIPLTASHDACQQTAICLESENRSGSSTVRDAVDRLSRLQGGRTLLDLTKSFGFGACLTIAIGTAVHTPSASAAESWTALPPALDAGQNAIRVPPVQPMTPSTLSAGNTAPADPLEAIASVGAVNATPAELQKQIILSIPLTDAPTSGSTATEEPVSRELTEFMEFEDMRVPVWIVDTILRASKATGADPVYMMALADKESSFLPGNKASTSSALGLFQFISSTWLEAVKSFGPMHGLIAEAEAVVGSGAKIEVTDATMREHILGLRRNPYISALMAAEMMKRDKGKIETKLGRKLSRSEFYLSHFFGVDSASRFIALVDDTPKKSAPDAFPAAAKSNKSLFFTKDGKKTRQLSVAEVYDKIDDMIDKRLNRYEAVSARATADGSAF